MTFVHPLPWWGILIATATIVWIAARAVPSSPAAVTGVQRSVLITLRVAALLLVLVFLMRPVRVEPREDTAGPVVPILVDVSASMSIRDEGEQSRLDRAFALVDELVPQLRRQYATETLAFGRTLDLVPESHRPGPTASASDLAAAVDALYDRYRGRAVAGVIVVSDGAVSTPTPDRAARLGVPVFTIGVGATAFARDREVLGVTVGEPVMADSVVDLLATFVARGEGAAPIDVRLLENGRPIDGRRILANRSGAPVRAVFRVSPSRNVPSVYTVETVPVPGEITAANNRISVLAPPAGRPRRLLFVEGAPGHEHSFLKRSWQQDQGLSLDSVVRKGQNVEGEDTFYVQAAATRSQPLVNGFPSDRKTLFEYDAVVLGNLDIDTLGRDQLGWLADFVGERGGGLLLLGAQTFDARSIRGTALEPLVPFDAAGGPEDVYRAALTGPSKGAIWLTPDGQEHPIMRLGADLDASRDKWAAMPSLVDTTSTGPAKPGASVLAYISGPGGIPRPLVVVERYGRGRVLAFTGEASFRWRMMLPSTDRTYDIFWRQAARWVTAGATDPVAVTVDDVSGGADLRISVRDAAYAPVNGGTVRARVGGPDGASHELTALLADAASGAYRATLHADRPGVYRFDVDASRDGTPLGAATAWWLAGGINREMADPRRHDDVLAQFASDTGGRHLERANLSSLSRLLQASSPRMTPPEQHDLWHNTWSLVTLIGLLSTEWVLRRRWGLR